MKTNLYQCMKTSELYRNRSHLLLISKCAEVQEMKNVDDYLTGIYIKYNTSAIVKNTITTNPGLKFEFYKLR